MVIMEEVFEKVLAAGRRHFLVARERNFEIPRKSGSAYASGTRREVLLRR